MSEATGLGILDIAILEACQNAGGDSGSADSGSAYLKTQRILDALLESTGVGHRHAYEPLCDMARPWVSHLALIDFHGNYGSPDFGPAAPRYTECRLTPLGAAALAAEQHSIGPLPIGLINGNTHAGGTCPPLDPTRVLHAIRSASTLTDKELPLTVGLPSFPTGCAVEGDIDAFASGSKTELQLAARITELAADQLHISHLAPNCSASQIATNIQSRIERTSQSESKHSDQTQLADHRLSPPNIRDVNDHSTSLTGTRLVVTVERGSSLADARMFLDSIWGIRSSITVQLRRPIAELVRAIAESPAADLSQRLALIEAAIKA